MSDQEAFVGPQIDHNVYILGAGFSWDAGLPLINSFLSAMGDCLDSVALNQHGREAIHNVFRFRLRAAAAAYRAQLNVENIEELFSLASALEGENDSEYISTAIAATIDVCRRSSNVPQCDVTTYHLHPQAGPTNPDGPRRTELYQLYAELLSGKFCDRPERTKNTFITFNYDTLLEDGLHHASIPFTYGIPEQYRVYEGAQRSQDDAAIAVYKLHGSVNWAIDSSNKVKIYDSYDWVKERKEKVLLLPPTWRKFFGKELGAVWEGAVRALNRATRVVVLGFSMPPTDTHFKYLLIAGLQNNISLRKFFFINPALDQTKYPEEATRLRNNLFGILRRELEERGVIELVADTTMNFLLDTQTRSRIGRSHPSKVLQVTDVLGTPLPNRGLVLRL